MAFLKDIHERYFWIKDADDDQSNFPAELKNLDKGTEKIEKDFFLNNLGLSFSATKKVLNNFKGRLFPIKNLDKCDGCGFESSCTHLNVRYGACFVQWEYICGMIIT